MSYVASRDFKYGRSYHKGEAVPADVAKAVGPKFVEGGSAPAEEPKEEASFEEKKASKPVKKSKKK